MNKYYDIIDKRYLLMSDLLIVMLCVLMLLSSVPFKFLWFLWLFTTIIRTIIFIMELVEIIKIWRKKDV